MKPASFRRRTGLLLFFVFTSFLIQAQRTVTGRILSAEDQKPVVGATVKVKGTQKLTSTDTDGKFSIAASDKDVLVITNIGFTTRELKVTADLNNIMMATETTNLNEVVVTALGVKKETKRIGYSVQEVKGSDLLKARESNPVNSLVGKVAGLNVGINAEILASPTVLLRGSPLNFYVVDGIPINSDTWNISPDDIETYTVLKGPTAAALYGSRGINGAILITTKRGKKNNKGFTVEVNSSTQFNKGFIAIPKVQKEYG